MKILLLTHSFNSLTQRLYAELAAMGHELSVEFDIADAVSEEAVALYRPDLVLAPFLKRAIPATIWQNTMCWIVHPGIVGDRGPSALDWALQTGASHGGVTVLQAEAEMDAGPVWATVTFPLRTGRKASIYRQEVTTAAVTAIKAALEKLARGEAPVPLADMHDVPGQWHPLMTQEVRAIDWENDTTATVMKKIDAADGFPGVADCLFGQPCHLFDAWPEDRLRGTPGTIIARRETALCRATRDGAVWIGHVKRHDRADFRFKLPATHAFADECAAIPEMAMQAWWAADHATWQDIRYQETDGIGFLHFDFYNGAMSTRQCERLRDAFAWARTRPTRVILFMGGRDFWSNGIHLNLIEAAESPADASWANINAMDDLAEAILRCSSHLTVAVVGGNAGAGGCFLARACDEVWIKEGVVLNPHYRNMGNLYGSEFWTYLLPRRIGAAGAEALMRDRLPLLARDAVARGFYDVELPAARFEAELATRAARLVADFDDRIADRRKCREADEARQPLAVYRANELAAMRRNFYGFDPSYHVARWHFVHRSPHSWTPRHLARHRAR